MDRIDELWAAFNELRETVEKQGEQIATLISANDRAFARDERLEEKLDRKVDKPYER